MKLASWTDGDASGFGAVTEAGIADISDRWPTLKAALGSASLSDIEAAVAASTNIITQYSLAPPIPDPEKIICVGLNYRSHAEEAGLTVPERPSLFVRFPSSQVGHEQPIVRPKVSEQYDFEGELAVIIGRNARHVTESEAFDFVAGYTCFGEHSVRDWQMHSRQATPGKNFWHSGSMGPWMVTADEIPEPAGLVLTTRLNGKEMQHDSISNLIFSIPSLISYISSFAALKPGDVIVTGTPEGVGFTRKPPVFLKPGDRVDIEISSIGTLSNAVVDEED